VRRIVPLSRLGAPQNNSAIGAAAVATNGTPYTSRDCVQLGVSHPGSELKRKNRLSSAGRRSRVTALLEPVRLGDVAGSQNVSSGIERLRG
jgi:hypothetical protein